MFLRNIFLSRTGTAQNCDVMAPVTNLYLRMGTRDCAQKQRATLGFYQNVLVCVSLSLLALLHLSSSTERHIYKDPEAKRRKTRKMKCCKMKE